MNRLADETLATSTIGGCAGFAGATVSRVLQ